MAENHFIINHHSRDGLPQLAPEILQVEPKIHLQHGSFFITVEEFKARVSGIYFYLWKIQAFAKFAVDNFKKINESHLVQGDLEMFVDFFFFFFLRKEFVYPKVMYRKVYRKYPFEFLWMFDL